MKTLTDLLNLYLEQMRLIRMNPATIIKHQQRLKDFIRFLGEYQVEQIEDIRRVHIIEYQKYRRDYCNHYNRPDSIDAQNRYLVAVKKFLAFLKREGYLVYDPSNDIPYAKVPKRLPLAGLTLKEIKKLFSVIPVDTLLGYRDRTMYEIFYSSGIRREELRQLKIKNVDYAQGYLRVIGKGDKERVVPLGETACKYVENYFGGIRPNLLNGTETDLVFFGRHGKPLSNRLMDYNLKRYVRQSGLNKKITFHTFRRSCATGMIRNNANVMHVKELLGHQDMQSIQAYIDLTIVDLKKAHQKTHPREKNQEML